MGIACRPRQLRREARGVLFARIGGESDQVVDDDVDGAANGVAGEVGVIHGLGGDALSGESGIAVDEQRQIFGLAAFTGAVLLGAGAPDGDGIDRFKVARI
jgi:hypothetical protein